jgi:hypothetical protein
MTVYKKIKDMNFLKLLTNKLQRESNIICKFICLTTIYFIYRKTRVYQNQISSKNSKLYQKFKTFNRT